MQSLAYTTSVENPTLDVVEGVSDFEDVGQLLELMNVDFSLEEEISRHDIATNQLQSMYDEHTKELMNTENVTADTTGGEITSSTTNNFTLCDEIITATLKEQGLLNDELVKSRLEEVLQYVKKYSKSALS